MAGRRCPTIQETRLRRLRRRRGGPKELALESSDARRRRLSAASPASHAVDLLLDAGDETLEALHALQRAPARLASSFRAAGLVRLPGISLLGGGRALG